MCTRARVQSLRTRPVPIPRGWLKIHGNEEHKMKAVKHLVSMALALITPFSGVLAANYGLISRIDFVASSSSVHPDVVQIQIEGGFSQDSCDTTFAAIRRTETHLIS